MGHARALLALDSPEQMKKGRDEILKRQLTVRQAEGFVKKLKTGKVRTPTKHPEPHLADIVEQLKRHFKARVALRQTGRGGRLEISYTSLEDLTRIVEILNL